MFSMVLQKRSEFGRWAHLRGQQQTLRPQLSSRRQEAQQGAGPTTWEDLGSAPAGG